jgi:tetratricopeptide (TPR) repeat protein
MSKFLISIICSVSGLATGGSAQTTNSPLNETAKQQLTEYLQLASTDSEPAQQLRDRVWRSTAISHGELEPLLRELKARQKADIKRPALLRILRLQAHFEMRLGELSKARRTLEKLNTNEETIADTLSKAEIFDAMGRNKEAISAYDRLLKRAINDSLRNRVLLRKALMADGATKSGATKAKESPLAQFAKGDGISPELRNQAAIALALTGEQRAAVDLFVPTGEGSARFRQELRIAEWALESKALPKAKTAAWNAVRHANLKRDRRYALAVLVEAYRRDGKLDDLITRFASTEGLDAESREVWIDLLRERGKVAEALKLFRESKTDEFTADMRRELLEICRETNQDKTLEEAYASLIKTEPIFLEWRKGLTSFYLERGRRNDATAVWDDYLQITENSRYRMAAAGTLMEVGLDQLAETFARQCMVSGDINAKQSALLFLFEMHHNRGRREQARKVLEELDGIAPPASSARKELADAYERLGDLNKSIDVLSRLLSGLGNRITPDTRMKMALMLSKTGQEEAALKQWRSLWLETNSIARRRYVEERLMAVASRLGKLAQMAITLEKKLIAGNANDRESGLLVRLYIKVNDPVSATEIVEEHMRRSGKKQVDVLTEKARVFQSCQDYYNYEQVIKALLEVDPEGRPDYLRQLAMSMMERGQRKEARDVLAQLKSDKSDEVSDEFEAGVLAIAGMHAEALKSYRRGIARSPDRIDTYLLLSNTQRTLGLNTRSAGMFQYLAANAKRDDLFTIAIDGILNMRAANGNAGAPNRLIEWARRVVLERLASRPNKLYLYRLIADLSEELNDSATAIRSLKSAVPVAGEQRTQMLRELMAMAKKASGGNARPAMRILASGMAVPVVQRQRSNADFLMFGRRILGQAELVPPDVYIELGEAFLASGEVGNATKTFNQASRLPEFAEMRRRMAQAFETAGYPGEALRVYEKILSVENSDLSLITKVGELREQTGSDSVALDLYQRGLQSLLDRSAFATTGNKDDLKPIDAKDRMLITRGNRNSDDWDQRYIWIINGLLATMPESSANSFLDKQHQLIRAELQKVQKGRVDGQIETNSRISHHPRIDRRLQIIHRIGNAFRRMDHIENVEQELLAVFSHDERLVEHLVRKHLTWGNVPSARQLANQPSISDKQRQRLLILTGARSSKSQTVAISVPQASNLVLQLLTDDLDAAKQMLERVQLAPDDQAALEHIPILVGATSFLNAPDLTLSFCRHWIDLAVRYEPGLLYRTIQAILETGRRTLNKSQIQSLTEHVLTLVMQKPDKFAVFLQRLSTIRDTIGPDFITRKQIEDLIKARLETNDGFIFGVENMIVMLPAEERPALLRSIWDKISKTQRAYFLLNLVGALDTEVDKDFEDFLITGFRNSIGVSDRKSIFWVRIESLSMNARVNQSLRLGFLDIIAKDGSATTSLAIGQAALLFQLGQVEEAKKKVGQAMEIVTFSETGPNSKDDPRALFTYNRFLSSLAPQFHQHVLDVFGETEKQSGRSPATTLKRLNLRRQLGIQEGSVALLEAAVKEFPEEGRLRSQLARALQNQGSWWRALEIRESGIDASQKSATERQRLVTEWQNKHHPIRALKIRDGGPVNKTTPPDNQKQRPRTAARRALPVTIGIRSIAGATPVKTPNRIPRTIPKATISTSTGTRAKATTSTSTGIRGKAGTRVASRTTAIMMTPLKAIGAAARKASQSVGSLAAVKKAMDNNDEKGALVIFRKLWRIFSPVQSDPYSRFARTATFGKFGMSGRLLWPSAPKKKTNKKATVKKPATANRGGLSDLLTKTLTEEDHKRYRPRGRDIKRPDQITAPSVLVKTKAGQEEIECLLRSLDPSMLDSAIAKDIYGALIESSIANASPEKVLQDLLKKDQSKTADKTDLGKLAVLLDNPSIGSPEQLKHYAANAASNLNPKDQSQLQRLARLYARTGEPGKAATIFQWCAVVQTSGASQLLSFRNSSSNDLIAETRRTLDGEHLIKALDGILRLSDPGLNNQDSHITKVLNTWIDLVEPKQCLELSRWALERSTDLSMRPMRVACKKSALVYARGGDPEQAIRCLEIALCKLPKPSTSSYPYYLADFDRTGFISDYEIAVMFPKGPSNFVDLPSWLAIAAKNVSTWHAEKRLPNTEALPLLSVLAMRLHDLGQTEDAIKLLGPITAAAGTNANQHLFVVDVNRYLGKTAESSVLEMALFTQSRLNVERIPNLIAETIQRDGIEAGLALGEKACEMTLHPQMLAHLVAAAAQANDPAIQKRWDDLAADAKTARAKLNPSKAKPKASKAKSSPAPNSKKSRIKASKNSPAKRSSSGKKVPR